MDLVCHDKPGSSSLALNKIYVCVCSVESDSVIPWIVANQAPLSIEFSRQEYWRVGCHFLLQGIFPTPKLNLGLLCLLQWPADSSPLHHLGTLGSTVVNNLSCELLEDEKWTLFTTKAWFLTFGLEQNRGSLNTRQMKQQTSIALYTFKVFYLSLKIILCGRSDNYPQVTVKETEAKIG